MEDTSLAELNQKLQQSFIERAAYFAGRRIPVIPIPRGKKGPPLDRWQERAATNIQDLLRLNTHGAEANIGGVATQPGVCITDFDTPEIVSRIEQETSQKFPRTLTVTGSKPFPAGHRYWLQTDYSRRLGNRVIKGQWISSNTRSSVCCLEACTKKECFTG